MKYDKKGNLLVEGYFVEALKAHREKYQSYKKYQLYEALEEMILLYHNSIKREDGIRYRYQDLADFFYIDLFIDE